MMNDDHPKQCALTNVCDPQLTSAHVQLPRCIPHAYNMYSAAGYTIMGLLKTVCVRVAYHSEPYTSFTRNVIPTLASSANCRTFDPRDNVSLQWELGLVADNVKHDNRPVILHRHRGWR